MELKNLLNTDLSAEAPRGSPTKTHEESVNFSSGGISLTPALGQQMRSPGFNFSEYNPNSSGKVPLASNPNVSPNHPSIISSYIQYPNATNFKGNYPNSAENQDWRAGQNINQNGGAGKFQSFSPSPPNFQVGPTTGSTAKASYDDRREIRTVRPLQDVAAAQKTIERFKNKEITNQVQTIPTIQSGEFWEQPVLIAEGYNNQSTWAKTWKPEELEKVYSECYIKDLKNLRDVRRKIKEFKQVASSPNPEELWYARDIPIMHNQSCIHSKTNKNCMGCSAFWKCVQGVQEEIRPWGNEDLLRFEPEHSETFLGHIGMQGSFTPQQREMLACDSLHTMFWADDPNAVTIWGLVSPADVFKLLEDDAAGVNLLDQKTLVDPLFLEKKVKVIYAIQKKGQTLLVPSNWVYFLVRVGTGLTFSASWCMLRLKNITEARKSAEQNRSLGLYRPVNISSLTISAAYQQLELFECSESYVEKQAICDFLLKILPILKTLVLEEILGEKVNLSGLVILSYASTVDRLRKIGRNGRMPLSSFLSKEMAQIRNMPLPATENETYEDDELHFSCCVCKYILFNSRRSCKQCKGYDLCEPCYATHGKSHPHKMKRHRKTPLQNLMDLVDSVTALLNDFSAPKEKIEKDMTKEASKSLDQNTIGLNTRDSNKRKRDKPQRQVGLKDPKEKEREEAKDDTSYEEEVIDCICGNNKDLGFMISCEKCFAWLHGKCVGINKRNEPDEYYCPRCVKKQVALNASAKLSPKDFSPEQKLKEYHLIS